MRVISATDVDRLLDYPRLIDALRQGFAEGVVAPTRHHHTIERTEGTSGTLLLMPAWTPEPGGAGGAQSVLGVKVLTVNPDNNTRGEAAVRGVFFLADGVTGAPLALIDAEALTGWRTAAASALAASYLARSDARHLLVMGAGHLAPNLVRAHSAVRPIERISIWNRTPEKAETLAHHLRDTGLAAEAVAEREPAIREADIISCATISASPIVEGAWLKPGTHLDLVGAFRPDLRESDNAAVRRASLFVDTFDGALSEGGDLVQPIAAGVVRRDDVRADLAMLARGEHQGRRDPKEITLFKSTGTALEDLVAGRLIYDLSKA